MLRRIWLRISPPKGSALIRRMWKATDPISYTPDWFWCRRGFDWLMHGGWFLLSFRHPLWTLKWWWRFTITVPKERGWRWG